MMQIQHHDLFVSSFAEPLQGDLPATVESVTEHVVPIIGTPGVWDAWAVPSVDCGAVGLFSVISVEPIPDDCSHIRLRVQASQLDARLGVRVYVLSQ